MARSPDHGRFGRIRIFGDGGRVLAEEERQPQQASTDGALPARPQAQTECEPSTEQTSTARTPFPITHHLRPTPRTRDALDKAGIARRGNQEVVRNRERWGS